ncbi:PP0621 family protein [Massilia yuzhufengensis]|uniref:Uncharacterized protein n=1 Tax=Massilia yuzhufengensis TaxID=1164594 RepID=A0A1I1Q9C2_9BURK|nr:PP0621 family protein [Massilia yuzhufengensis]SFD18659.1 uncharacterized protein SAMN05216204_11886 [Massilia yuzhufengensis]
MSRILFWILLIALVGFAIRAKLKAASARQREAMRQQQRQAPPEPVAAIEDMAQCAHCGIHFPASEAVRADGHDYCSPGHVRLPPR